MSEMKSAFELAMERLGAPAHPLSDQQRQQLSDTDARAKAQVAETQIMFDQQLAQENDPAKAALIQQTRQQQIQRIHEETEAKKEQIRQSS